MKAWIAFVALAAALSGCAGQMHYSNTLVVRREPYVHRVEQWYVPGSSYSWGGGGFNWSSPHRGTVSGWEVGPSGKVRPVWRPYP